MSDINIKVNVLGADEAADTLRTVAAVARGAYWQFVALRVVGGAISTLATAAGLVLGFWLLRVWKVLP